MTDERREGTPEATTTEEDTLASLRAQLDEERARAERYHKNWQRAAADFQNYKRRTEEERQKNTLFANLALVLNMLPIYDDLERALTNLDVKLAGLQWVEGVRQIARKFQGALEASGVREIPAEGADFDPTLHEAIAQDEGEAGKVVRVIQKGYTMGDRVIRPAMVIVGRGEAGTGAEEEGPAAADTTA
jgi:molecular chaperone GrpE